MPRGTVKGGIGVVKVRFRKRGSGSGVLRDLQRKNFRNIRSGNVSAWNVNEVEPLYVRGVSRPMVQRIRVSHFSRKDARNGDCSVCPLFRPFFALFRRGVSRPMVQAFVSPTSREKAARNGAPHRSSWVENENQFSTGDVGHSADWAPWEGPAMSVLVKGFFLGEGRCLVQAVSM
jgi:hypothetical protein